MAQEPVVFIQDGESIPYRPSSAVTAGQVVVVNGKVYLAHGDIAAGELGNVHPLTNTPIYRFPKDSNTCSAGDDLFWHATGNPVGGTAGTGAVNTTSGGGTYVGKAHEDADAADATVKIEAHAASTVSVTVQTMLQDLIADPGASGAIPITASGHVEIVTAAAETRTLAAPSFIGQMLLVSLKTDGGDCVVTCATTVNQTGNNTITLGDAGDAVLLVAKANGTDKRWSVVSNDGAALATA